jgi:hypothetical protein
MSKVAQIGYNHYGYIFESNLEKRGGMKPIDKPEGMLPLSPAVFHILLALADGERCEECRPTQGRSLAFLDII